MRYLIIGLGIYGSNLARNLTAMGHEVIGVDVREANVEAEKDFLSTVYMVDTTDESALGVLPLNNVDLVIVCIGENFGASVKTVALLKKQGVQHIYARAIDELHHSILECFDLDYILTPEQRAAHDLSVEMMLGTAVVTMPVAEDTYIAKFAVPDYYVGANYSDLKLEDYGIRLVAASRGTSRKNLIGIMKDGQTMIDITAEGAVVRKGDILTCLCTPKDLRDLKKHTG